MKTRAEILAAYRRHEIDAAGCAAALRKLPGIRFGMTVRREEIFATDVELDETTRTITGTITVFGVVSTDGRVVEPGALTARAPLDRVKLLIDHDHTQAVGYMTKLDVTDELARATFHVPETPEGDDALNRAKLKLRNGLSIGMSALPGSYFWDEEDVIHFVAGELYETSLCAIPAFQDAQVEEVAAQLARTTRGIRMNREQILAAFAAGRITAEQRDAALAALNAVGVEAAAEPTPVAAPGVVPPAAGVAPQLAVIPTAPGVAVPVEYAAGPTGAPQPTDHGHAADRPLRFREVKAEIARIARTGDRGALARYVNYALGTIGVDQVDDEGAGFLRPAWLGELWTASPNGRPWIDSFGGASELTSDKLEGFRWAFPSEYTEAGTDKEARMKIYAGDFAEVPTGTRKLVKVTADPDQWGVGVKVDNITIDLGSPDLVESLFGLFARDYDQDSDARVRALIVAAATAPFDPDGADAGTDPDPHVDASIIAALSGAAMSLKRIGAGLDRVWLSEDVFTDFSELTVAQLPAWLANQLGFVDLTDGSIAVSSKLKMDVDFGLASGSLLAYDKRAATVKEKRDIRLEAIDVGHRATDIGLFSYGGVIVNDARAIVHRTIS